MMLRPPPTEAPVSVRISAALASDAVCRKTIAATPAEALAWLYVELQQPGGAPCRARWLLGAGPAAAISGDAAARALHRGARVTVHARGWHLSNTPAPHLELTGVDFIEHTAAPARHEPRAPRRHDATPAIHQEPHA